LNPTESRSAKSPPHEWSLQADIERCRAEIAHAESQLRAGHPDIQGLCLALSDWSAELKILEFMAR
jgi:hypothetical protein